MTTEDERAYRRERNREWRRRRRQKDRKDNNSYKVGHAVFSGPTRPKKDEIAARLAEIPEDTRPLTARLMGDPLPGRGFVKHGGLVSPDSPTVAALTTEHI